MKSVELAVANVIDENELARFQNVDVVEEIEQMEHEVMMDSVRVTLLKMRMMTGSEMHLDYLRGLVLPGGEAGMIS